MPSWGLRSFDQRKLSAHPSILDSNHDDTHDLRRDHE